MSTIGVRINGKEYFLACDDGQEERLRLLADDVDERVRAITFRNGANIGEVMTLLMASITMADELIENKKKIEELSSLLQNKYGKEEYYNITQNNTDDSENAVISALEEIAQRIENIAERLEMR